MGRPRSTNPTSHTTKTGRDANWALSGIPGPHQIWICAFSEAVRVGQVLYLSGQLGVDGSGAPVSGGIKAETKQALENIRSILERNNSGMDQVVKCTVMLADIADRTAMSEIYVTFFPKDRLPARSTFGTTGLALGAKVEIECMATIKLTS